MEEMILKYYNYNKKRFWTKKAIGKTKLLTIETPDYEFQISVPNGNADIIDISVASQKRKIIQSFVVTEAFMDECENKIKKA
jgi:hypothetical protein